MTLAEKNSDFGSATSPGGFVFGVSGWSWGEPKPTSITFFLDGTAKVSDQHGRPIKGTVINGKEIRFAQTPPSNDEQPGSRSHLASHVQVIEALAAERIDWQTLSWAGFPQLPYTELSKVNLPPTPIEELMKIRDPQLRKDALKMRREVIGVAEKELAEAAAE